MIYISIALLAVLFILLIASAKESLPEGIPRAFYSTPFYKAGRLFYRKLFENRDKQSSYYQKMYDAKNVLSPAGRTGPEVELYFIKKVGLCLIILFVGLSFLLLKSYADAGKTLIHDNKVAREESGGKDYSFLASVSFEGEDIDIQDYSVEVASREYTSEEIEQILEEFHSQLEVYILGDNTTSDFVNSDIHMPTSIGGYPFSLEYDWDDKKSINRNGKIGEDIPDDGVIVTFDVSIKYKDFIEHYLFAVHVFPRTIGRMEYLQKQLDMAISKLNVETGTSEYMELPDEVDGISVKWTEEKENNLIVFFLLIIASIVGLFIAEDKDLYKKLEERNEQMMEDYSEIVSKLTLLIGAGMTVRGAWRKIALDYKAKRDEGDNSRFAYEEMLLTIYEMDNGVEETVCYNHFSGRARVQKYVKLVSLLDQNLKLGSKTMLSTLREEARDAAETRRNLIEKKGEEAGTKLLVPMMLMLVVVVVVIMFPAFMSM